MEAGEDRVTEETYEDPAQAMQEEGADGQDVYEEPQSNINVVPPSPPTSSAPITTQPPTSPSQQDTFLESTMTSLGSRDSMLLAEADWSDAYDTNAKKGEKIRAADLKNVIHKGWLEKLGGRNQKSWQKRYCVISGVFMYFFEKESSRTYNNRISLPNYIPNPSNELTHPKKKQFAFKLSATEETKAAKDYFFRSTEEERTQWVDAMRAAFELGRPNVSGKRMSQTLPRMSLSSSSSQPTSDGTWNRRTGSVGDIEQEDYEAVVPVMTEEEGQDDYVDVSVVTMTTDRSLHPKYGSG